MAASLLSESAALAADGTAGATRPDSTTRHNGAGAKPAKSALSATQTIVVRGASPAALARTELDQVPGGASVVNQKAVTKSVVQTDQAVLAYQPGVYAQSADGADGLKISIRGSGLQNGPNYFRQGIYILFDGLPVTGPAGTPYELFEPLGLEQTEILRGANAFNLGAVDLGGAINYATLDGYDALPAQARYEFGSFGYQKEQLSSGKVIGPFDYYISFTNSYRSGYQDHSRATSTGVVLNLGYQINDWIDTRLFVRYRQTADQYPGYLTSTQIAQDPTQAQAPYYQRGYDAVRIQPGSTWVGSRTTFRIDDESRFVFGLVYHNYPIDIRETIYDATWGYDDLTPSLLYERNDHIDGHASNTTVGFFSTTHLNGYQNTVARVNTGVLTGIPFGSLLRRAKYEGSDNNLHAENDTNVWRGLWATAGVSLVYTKRAAAVTIPVSETPTLSVNAVDLAPRFGLRYQFDPALRVFGNVSRSIEPPNDWEYLTGPLFTSGPLTGLNRGTQPLRDETAWTWEIGTSGQRWGEDWSIDYYHSDVRNELLEVTTAASLAAGTAVYGNASPTVHQGVEASLTSTLWQGAAGRLSLRQAYTLNLFNFKDDALFGRNQLPGVPRHYYQGEVRFDAANHLYLGFSAEVASRIPIDYANTDDTRPYHTLGLTIGYDDDKHARQVFLNFSNLANEHYAAVVSPTVDDHGVPGAFLVPGDGFGVFAGIDVGLK